MSFAIRNLSVLAYANGFTLWHYKAEQDTLQALHQPGYFNDAMDMLTGGDMVLATAPTGGGVLCIADDEGRLVASALG